MNKLNAVNQMLLSILAFTGGFSFSSMFITKSTNWYISLPIFVIALISLIINVKKNKWTK